jgi:hypothetical protein
MATCERKSERVPVVVEPTYINVNRYHLVLSQQEAETLMMITHAIGGAERGRRGDTTRIQQALLDAGIKEQCNHGDKNSGNIYFQDLITSAAR